MSPASAPIGIAKRVEPTLQVQLACEQAVVDPAGRAVALPAVYLILHGGQLALVAPPPQFVSAVFDGRRRYLHCGDAWTIDADALHAAAHPGTRAVIAVNPNNPTGSYLAPFDRAALGTLCRDRDIPLIVDEVFNRYPIDPRPDVARSILDGDPDPAIDTGAATAKAPVTFTLGGLSKAVGLPQLKLAWIVTTGPAPLDALDLLTDTYLSVATPVQLAAAHFLTAGAAITRQIQSRITANYQTLATAAAAHPFVTPLRTEGGWSAVLRFAAAPDPDSEEALALHLLEEDQILVHPGYFFDVPAGAHVVVSLLPDPASFAPAAARLVARAAGR